MDLAARADRHARHPSPSNSRKDSACVFFGYSSGVTDNLAGWHNPSVLAMAMARVTQLSLPDLPRIVVLVFHSKVILS